MLKRPRGTRFSFGRLSDLCVIEMHNALFGRGYGRMTADYFRCLLILLLIVQQKHDGTHSLFPYISARNCSSM
jgi:hypothetical protein